MVSFRMTGKATGARTMIFFPSVVETKWSVTAVVIYFVNFGIAMNPFYKLNLLVVHEMLGANYYKKRKKGEKAHRFSLTENESKF